MAASGGRLFGRRPVTFYQPASKPDLQASLSAGSAMASLPRVLPHHPLTCPTKLFFDVDGRFGCDHVTVDADDQRTRFAVDQSIAMLLIEQAFKL